ncbi:Cell division topological specificity factor [Buchnera aphidicola (Phyllaphis fagi)]|uniref:cell division topological specificity factor MinE n=1 Tax=Buchnera aphidicola TaxID=9 RepID=UPI0034639F57
MTLLDFFTSRNTNTADIAKKRLQIIISKKKRNMIHPKYILDLQKELFSVICKYIKIDPTMITIQLDQKKSNVSILELNIILPE